MIVVLYRFESEDTGTIGRLLFPGGELYAIEPPDRGNARGESCIPAGIYTCAEVQSPRFGRTYEVLNVPGRTHILFHAGNWGGDEAKGLRTDTDGCILPGMEVGKISGQRGVSGSKAALDQFLGAVEFAPFTLIVVDGAA